MHLLAAIIILIIYGISKLLNEGAGRLSDYAKSHSDECDVIDPNLYRDHIGLLREKGTNEYRRIVSKNHRVYTIDGDTGKIIRDITELANDEARRRKKIW